MKNNQIIAYGLTQEEAMAAQPRQHDELRAREHHRHHRPHNHLLTASR